MESPIFSIVVPVYNRSFLIQKTIQSLLNQSFGQYEIIVVDDGSTDDTYSVVKSIDSPILRLYTKANGERAAARNFGAKQASGDYLIFFDSDDLMYPHHLASVYDFLQSNNYPAVAYTGFEYINNQGDVLKQVLINNQNFKRKLVLDNFLGCNSVVIRKDVFVQFWFNEDRKLTTSEDRELWLRIAAAHAFSFIPVIGFAMVEHEGRSLRKLNASRIDEIKMAMINSLNGDTAFKQGFPNLYKYLFAYEISLLISVWAVAGAQRRALKYLFRAVNLHPGIIISKRFIAGVKNLILS